jgi:pimeloyl-ACP methyl ester carboxylesterase
VESRFATVNGVRLNYGEGPANGPSLTYLVGFPDAWDDYPKVLEALGHDYHVFAPSMRGLGESGHAARYSIADWVADTAAFVRDVVGAPTLGVGHSAGAWFGLSAAGQDPGLFRAFVALDQPLDPRVHVEFHERTRPTYAGFAAAMRAGGGIDRMARQLASVPSSRGGTLGDGETEAELRDLARWLSRCDPAIFDAWVHDELASWLYVPELQGWPGAYAAPVRFVYGDPTAGSMVDEAARRYNQDRYPWAEVAELPGTDHGLGMEEDPGRVTAVIGDYLARFREG